MTRQTLCGREFVLDSLSDRRGVPLDGGKAHIHFATFDARNRRLRRLHAARYGHLWNVLTFPLSRKSPKKPPTIQGSLDHLGIIGISGGAAGN